MNDLAEAVATYGDGLRSSTYGALDASDHAPFEWAGFEACLLIEGLCNPYYHTQMDSVDTPDYIDYAFATRITRSVVGFLVDQAGVIVDFPDCNENDVFDLNDIRNGTSEDCNENEIPDECETARAFRWASGELSPLQAGSTQSYAIDSPQSAGSDVTFSFTAYADLESEGEFVEVWINGVAIAAESNALFVSDGSKCADPPDTTEIILTAEEFNIFVDEGEVVIEMIPSPGVSPATCSTPSYITVTVEYESAGNSIDCNANFVPDSCEEPGDLDGDGFIGLGDHALAVECLSGPCGNTPCDPALYVDPCCALTDYDLDGDYDLADFAAHQREISSP